MKKIVIHKPIWAINGFGIALYHFDHSDVVEVSCDYRKKDGELWDPNVYVCTAEIAFGCDRQMVCGGVIVAKVPKSKLILKEGERCLRLKSQD